MNFNDDAEALSAAAALGNTGAMINLGVLYQKAGDVKSAESWFQKAINLDEPGAMYSLGCLMYDSYLFEDAKSYWQKAGALGHEGAESLLAILQKSS